MNKTPESKGAEQRRPALAPETDRRCALCGAYHANRGPYCDGCRDSDRLEPWQR